MTYPKNPAIEASLEQALKDSRPFTTVESLNAPRGSRVNLAPDLLEVVISHHPKGNVSALYDDRGGRGRFTLWSYGHVWSYCWPRTNRGAGSLEAFVDRAEVDYLALKVGAGDYFDVQANNDALRCAILRARRRHTLTYMEAVQALDLVSVAWSKGELEAVEYSLESKIGDNSSVLSSSVDPEFAWALKALKTYGKVR